MSAVSGRNVIAGGTDIPGGLLPDLLAGELVGAWCEHQQHEPEPEPEEPRGEEDGGRTVAEDGRMWSPPPRPVFDLCTGCVAG